MTCGGLREWARLLLVVMSAAGSGLTLADDHTVAAVTEPVPGGLPRADGFALRTWTRVLANRGFTVGYSELRRNPLWVTYQARPLPRRRAYRRPEGFEVDRRTFARVNSRDYARSGYQRGHLAPSWLIAQLYGREAQRQTFLMSNITPQKPGLNQKLWQRLEEIESDRFARWFGGVWVITGPVFDHRIERLDSGVELPDAFYRIFIDRLPDGQLEVLALVVPQSVRGNESLTDYLSTVDEIERLTGLDFLSGLDDGQETALESAPADAEHWRLREVCCQAPRY